MGKSGGNGTGGGGGGGRGGYKNKSKAKMYYLKQAKTKKRGGPQGTSGGGDGGGGKFTKLAVGMRGFLCTTNYNEKNAVKEAYNLLNEYHDEKDDVLEDVERTDLYSSQEDRMSGQRNLEEGGAPGLIEEDDEDGDRSLQQEGQTAKPEENILKPVDDSGQTSASPVKKPRMDSDDEDVESALAAEITVLKSSKVKYKFQSVDTGVRNLIFINTTVKDPVKLAHKILEDLSEKKVQKSRYLLRMLPVEAVCRAEISDIKKTAESLFPKYFKTGFNSFQVVYKSRYNDSLDRAEVIRVLANAVMEINTFNTVNLNDSKFSLIVEIFRNMCCLGVVTDFNKLRKYNLIEAASAKVQGSQSTDKEAVAVADSVAENSSGASAVPEASQDSSADQIKTDD